MHSESVTKYLKNDFATKKLEDSILFIESSWNNHKDLHLAIVNEIDEYLGTVSLKNIKNETAEFAIVLRASAFGLGVGKKAMSLILEFGQKNLKLKEIYWCVSIDNGRAVSFYNKNGYKTMEKICVDFRS